MSRSSRTGRANLNPRQRGSSLVEILATMFLVGVGLLGVAGLQLTGLKNTMNANLRTQAAIHAYDIVDRMRANVPNASSYVIALGSGIPAASTAIAGTDLREWKTSLAASLPGGDGAIARTGNRVTVTIQWTERVPGTGAGTTGFESRQFQMTGEL